MKIPRLSMITLGVADLAKAASFYEAVLATPPNRSYDGVVFIELPGSWLALYPIDALAADISSEITPARTGFSGITLAHNARNREDVIAVIDRARNAGARILREPQETFWGGFNGYFADRDGYCWEIAWGPMFGFDEHGDMHFLAG
ncbi:MAG: VOC family protein [Desulfofustis sp.]|nr:VOC family protein [Desulfofustis sp.]